MPSTRNNSEAQEFLTRGAGVIIRMRGLPYDSTAQQITEFFASGDTDCISVMDGTDGVLFVNKADGRATGDAFVLFKTDEEGQKALAKHKQLIGTRYIELFRSSNAEVQQVINKSMEPARKPDLTVPSLTGLIGPVPSALPSLLPQQLMLSSARKDCIRLRGLPYEAQVQHILEFLGDFSAHIALQGVHIVYNSQWQPNGEAFIQMKSDQAAAATAMDRHNKYMQIAKKQRYIEVFQCSADDMNLVLTGPMPASTALPTPNGIPFGPATVTRMPLSPAGNGMPPGVINPPSAPNFSAPVAPNLINIQMLHQLAIQNQLIQRPLLVAAATQPGHTLNQQPTPFMPFMNTQQGPVVYWPYPSPPVSPTNSFYAAAAQNQAVAAAALAAQQAQQAQHQHHQHQHQQQIQQQLQQHQQQQQMLQNNGPAIVLMRGLPFNTSVTDILSFFQGFHDVNAEAIQIQRVGNGAPSGDALVTFTSRFEAERAVIEKNRHLFGPRPVDLYLCTV